MMQKSNINKYKCSIGEKVDELDKEYTRSKVCQNLSTEYEHEGKHYCLLHYPGLDKIEAFEKEFQRRLALEDYNFRGVYFPIPLSLFSKNFEKHIDFMSATFTKDVRISSTTFAKPIDFIDANFMAYTSFYEVSFLKYVSFHAANFDENSDVHFSKTKFGGEVDFSYASLKGYVTFEDEQDNHSFFSEESFLNLQNARIEKPERILFHNVRLKPSWFINVDCNNFVLSDCIWRKANNKYVDAKSELHALIKREMPKPHKLLRRTSWRLANNYEESKKFYTSSLFRQIANESKRLAFYNGFKIFTLHWWYWFSSFYGESWQRAFLVLVIIIFALYPLIYTQTNFQTCSKDRPIATSLSVCESKDEEIRKNCTCSTN